MSPQGDLIQLSPSCNGRYINPKGGSSRPRCQPFLQKLQHWTNRAVNWVDCTSQTPGFKDAPLRRVQLPSSGGSGTGYGFLNFGRQTINHSPWPCMGHTHNFQSSGWGCQILPWSWDSKSRLIGISQGGRYKRGVSSENQVWEGQNGAMRRRRAPLTFTLYSTAGISFIGGNAYRLTFGHGWANASMPRVVGKLRENQSGHWDDSWEAKRSTSALPNRSQIWDTVWRFNIHSPGLSFCLDRKSSARFSTPGTWTALKERNLSWDQRRRWRASLSRVRDLEPPWWFMWDTTAILSVLTMTWYPPRTGRKYFKARKTALSSRQFICQKRNSSFHSPLAGLPSKTAPQPVIDASVVIIWRRWIAPILTPLWRKTGSRHINRCRQQLRDTLIRRVAGTVGCNLSSFIHQRNGLMWSSPRGNTGEAAAIRPNSLRQVPTETWWPSLKRSRHAVRTGIRAGAKRACIWTETLPRSGLVP